LFNFLVMSALLPWANMLQRRVEKSRPGTRKQLEKFFHWVPADLLVGPWSWSGTLVYSSLSASVLCSLPWAAGQFAPAAAAEELRGVRFAGFVFGMLPLTWMCRKHGPGPLISWTMLGWTIATLRYLAGALAWRGVQRVLCAPALIANTVTLLVWYLAILPGMTLQQPRAKRWKFCTGWIFNPFLFIVHGINFPFAVLDWYIQPERLELFDLWCGLFYSMIYMTFYLFVLDQIGAPLYFILSPRKWWSGPLYIGMLTFGCGILYVFNAWEARLRGSIL